MNCMLLSNIGENLGINAEMHFFMYYMKLPNDGGNLGIITEMHSVMDCMRLLNKLSLAGIKYYRPGRVW